MERNKDLFMLKVRLYRFAQIRWNLSAEECNRIFERYDIDGYIDACYEEYHVQGDEASIRDIESYLKNKGYTFDSK